MLSTSYDGGCAEPAGASSESAMLARAAVALVVPLVTLLSAPKLRSLTTSVRPAGKLHFPASLLLVC